jgi:hypothetical protein
VLVKADPFVCGTKSLNGTHNNFSKKLSQISLSSVDASIDGATIMAFSSFSLNSSDVGLEILPATFVL